MYNACVKWLRKSKKWYFILISKLKKKHFKNSKNSKKQWKLASQINLATLKI